MVVNQTVIWVIVALVVIAVLLGIAMLVRRRRQRVAFKVQGFPANYIDPYEQRMEEIEKMFVSQPREAVAAAKLLVDDMLTRMGYPVRMTGEERARALRQFNRTHADRYQLASRVKTDSSTEDMRKALQAYLETARELVADARRDQSARQSPGEGSQREAAG